VLGNLINRHDAVRLGRRLRRGHVTQIVSTGPREASFAALPRLGADFVCAVCSPRVEPWTGLEAGQGTATRGRTAARLGYDAT
jgi:hypothetical protein